MAGKLSLPFRYPTGTGQFLINDGLYQRSASPGIRRSSQQPLGCPRGPIKNSDDGPNATASTATQS